MQTRTYFATSMEAAMQQARNELGVDALLLKSRAGAMSGLPGYEVVFGVDQPETGEQSAPQGSAKLSSNEFQQLSAQLDEIRAVLARSAQAGQKTSRPLPELSNLQACLIASEIDPVLSKDIIDRVEASLAVDAICQRADAQAKAHKKVRVMMNFDYDSIERRMRRELKRRLRIAAQIAGKLAVFVGPTGSGKTTSMMKLALTAKGRVKLLSLDASPGAREEMRLYATSSGLDFVPLGSASKLPKMIQGMKDADLIMLDTPGFTAPDSKEAVELAAALGQCPGADVFLVVAGYMKADDLQRTIERYTKFGFSKIIVTKLDETGGLGSVYSETVRAGKNISYLTDGTRIPQDIRPATADEILNLALAGSANRELHAA